MRVSEPCRHPWSVRMHLRAVHFPEREAVFVIVVHFSLDPAFPQNSREAALWGWLWAGLVPWVARTALDGHGLQVAHGRPPRPRHPTPRLCLQTLMDPAGFPSTGDPPF